MRRALFALAAAVALSLPAVSVRAAQPLPDFDQGIAVPEVLKAAHESAAATLGVQRVREFPSAGSRAIFILKSPGVCDGCAESVSKMLFTAGIHSQILGPDQLKKAVGPRDVVVIGGSEPDADGEWTVKKDLVKAGAFDWLKEHIANGGRYIGICAGAYLTEKWIDEDADERGLDIFPGKVDNYIEGKKTKYILTRWPELGIKRYVYFQDGPAFYPAAGADISVLGRFTRDGTVAAAIFPYGKGKVGVLSPHLEADETWAKQAHLEDPDGSDYDLGLSVFRKVIE